MTLSGIDSVLVAQYLNQLRYRVPQVATVFLHIPLVCGILQTSFRLQRLTERL